MNFISNVQNRKEFSDRTLTTIQVYKQDKKEITANEVNILIKQLLEKAPKDSKLMVRGLGINRFNQLTDGPITLKSFESQATIVQDEDEYLAGKVKDTTKFQKFSQLQIVLQKPKIKTETKK